MEHLDSHPTLNPAVAADLQGVSLSHRSFVCHSCKVSVKLCRKCDRGNIYCPPCQLPQKSARISRARKSYKSSPHGLKTRALGNRRRREKKLVKLKFEGDRGSPSCPDKTMTPEPTISDVALCIGVTKYDQNSNGTCTSQLAKVPGISGNIPTVSCSNCKGTCLDFQKKSTGRLSAKETKRLLKWLADLRDKVS
jgi:hypothetical protein